MAETITFDNEFDTITFENESKTIIFDIIITGIGAMIIESTFIIG